jgi:hypothetical protein
MRADQDDSNMGKRKYLQEVDNRITPQDPEELATAIFILHDQLNLSTWPEWVRKEKPLLIFMEATVCWHPSRMFPEVITSLK